LRLSVIGDAFNRFKQIKANPFPDSCKVKASDQADFCNQASNSRAAVFEDFFRSARGRLATQAARARTRSSSGAFARECAELPTEIRKLSTAARRCGGLGVKPRGCFSFAGVFFFK